MQYRMKMIAFILLGLTSNLATGADCDWSGKWTTNFSDINIYQIGIYVSGDYPGWDAGRIDGTVSEDGKRLDGNWYESPSYAPPTDTGPFEFEISEDCNSFTGLWAYDNSDGFVGSWSGTRDGPVIEGSADLLVTVSGGATLVDGVPVSDNGHIPLEQGSARTFVLTDDSYLMELRLRCQQTDPSFMLIEDLSSLPPGQVLRPGVGLGLILTSMTSRLRACDEVNGRRNSRSTKGQLPLLLDMNLNSGGVRISNLLPEFRSLVGTTLVDVTLDQSSEVIVVHNDESNTTWLWSIDSPILIDPLGNGQPSFILEPDQLVVIDQSGVGQPVITPLFSDTFE